MEAVKQAVKNTQCAHAGPQLTLPARPTHDSRPLARMGPQAHTGPHVPTPLTRSAQLRALPTASALPAWGCGMRGC